MAGRAQRGGRGSVPLPASPAQAEDGGEDAPERLSPGGHFAAASAPARSQPPGGRRCQGERPAAPPPSALSRRGQPRPRSAEGRWQRSEAPFVQPFQGPEPAAEGEDGLLPRHSPATGLWDGVGRYPDCEGRVGTSLLRQSLPACWHGPGAASAVGMHRSGVGGVRAAAGRGDLVSRPRAAPSLPPSPALSPSTGGAGRQDWWQRLERRPRPEGPLA